MRALHLATQRHSLTTEAAAALDAELRGVTSRSLTELSIEIRQAAGAT